MNLDNLHVLVLGLGESGLAMARWCARAGAHVRVWDSRESPPHAEGLARSVPAATLMTGALELDALKSTQLVLKSPGLAPTDERIAALLGEARQHSIAIQGELDLFARALADLRLQRGYAPHVIAITGTNGKTTTTSMTARLIARTGRRVFMAGNIGPTLLQTLADALDLEPPIALEVAPEVDDQPDSESQAFAGDEQVAAAIDLAADGAADIAAEVEAEDDPFAGGGPPAHLIPPPPPGPRFEYLPEVWVLELSSFQLDEVRGFEPSAATVLNVTQDHQDWHGSMDAYAAAKARVFGTKGVMLINRDDPMVEKMVPVSVPVKGRGPKPVPRRVVRFGLGAPRLPGDYGVLVENGVAWLVRALEADETIKRGKRNTTLDEELHIQRLMPAEALLVRGRHNTANALAALALATAIGCPLAPMLHELREYQGEPHRVEFVASVNGVEAYDDSKGTNVGATVAALNGLGTDKAPAKLLVILGGDGKGQDFTPLMSPVQRYVRAVATLGRDAEAIEVALKGSQVPLQRHATLEGATRWVFQQARSGDAVLLSPACASLDMFRNYSHRAQVFVDEVRALASEQGSVAV